MRDYTRVYLLGLSVLCLVLIIVVATVPAHKSYVDESVSTVSDNLTTHTGVDHMAFDIVFGQLDQLNTQLLDAQEKLSLLRKDTSSMNTTNTDFNARLSAISDVVNNLNNEITAVHGTVNDLVHLINTKPDAAKVQDLSTQIGIVQTTQQSIIASIQRLYEKLSLIPVSGNTTN